MKKILKEEYDDRILDILDYYGYRIPDDSIITDIKPSVDANFLLTVHEVGKGKYDTNKIGKVLNTIFPDMDVVGDKTVTKMIEEIKEYIRNSDNYDFEVHKNISDWYIKLHQEIGLSSCVTNEDKIDSGFTKNALKPFDEDDRVSIVIIKNKDTGELIGRALLWDLAGELNDFDNLYLDRTYPSANLIVHNAFAKWAKSNGYLYRESISHRDYTLISGGDNDGGNTYIYFDTGKKIEELEVMPYMDTFRFGFFDEHTEKLILTNDSDEATYTFDKAKGVFFNKNKDTFICHACRREYSQEIMLTGLNDEYYCEDCWHDAFVYCEHCNELIWAEDCYWVDDQCLCEDCYNEKYISCEYCGEHVEKENVFEIKTSHGLVYSCKRCCIENAYKCQFCDIYFYNTIPRYVVPNKSVIISNPNCCDACFNINFDKPGIYTIRISNMTEDSKRNAIQRDLELYDDHSVLTTNITGSLFDIIRFCNFEYNPIDIEKIYLSLTLIEPKNETINYFTGERKNILIEKMVNVVGFKLNEAVNITKKFEEILNIYGYDYPSDEIVKSINLTDEMGTFEVEDQDGKQMTSDRIGFLLKKLFPGIKVDGSDPVVQKMMTELKLLSNVDDVEYIFETYDSISDWYIELYDKDVVDSCVTWEGRRESGLTELLLKSLDIQDDIKVVVMKEATTGKLMGRALLWENIPELDAPFVDRIYPFNNIVYSQFYKWIRKNGYYDSTDIDYKRISYNFNKSAKEVIVMPFMDTFKYGKEINGKLTIFNKTENRNEERGYYKFNITDGTWFVQYDKAYPEFDFNIHCENCNKVLYKDESIIGPDRKVYCSDCLSENFVKCDRCDKSLKDEDIKDVPLRHEQVCKECFKQYYFECSCGYKNLLYKGHKSKFYSTYFCDACYKKKHYKCSACMRYYALEDSEHAKKSTPDGKDICTACYKKLYFKCRVCSKSFSERDMSITKPKNYICRGCYSKSNTTKKTTTTTTSKDGKLIETFLNSPNKKLSGEMSEEKKLYKGKKFSDEYSIDNFGIDIDSISELIINNKYNIYLKDYDMWFCEYKFKPLGVGKYIFRMDVSNETDPLDSRNLSYWARKGYIVNFIE